MASLAKARRALPPKHDGPRALAFRPVRPTRGVELPSPPGQKPASVCHFSVASAISSSVKPSSTRNAGRQPRVLRTSAARRRRQGSRKSPMEGIVIVALVSLSLSRVTQKGKSVLTPHTYSQTISITYRICPLWTSPRRSGFIPPLSRPFSHHRDPQRLQYLRLDMPRIKARDPVHRLG